MKTVYKVSMFFIVILIILGIGMSYLYLGLKEEIENSSKKISKVEQEYMSQINELSSKITNLENEIKEKNEEAEKEVLNEDNDDLDKSFFLVDFKNYKPENNEVKITEQKAKEIAEKGFTESAKRVTSEGADDIQSQRVEIKDVYANNYFTRKNGESDQDYKDIYRKCYLVSRENEMGNGIIVYIDVTTGLIIGGEAYGD